MEIRFSQDDGVAPKDFGSQNATIADIGITKSRFPQPRRGGGLQDAYQLRVALVGDNGKKAVGYYGGVYPNADGSTGFGKGGFARRFIEKWSAALGREPMKLEDLRGTRCHYAVVEQVQGGYQSCKLFPDGPATTPSAPIPVSVATGPVGVSAGAPAQPAAPVQPVNPFAGMNLAPAAPPAPPAPAFDPVAAFAAIPETVRTSLIGAAKNSAVQPAQLVSALTSNGFAKTQAEAEAIVAHAKGLP